MSQVKPNFYRVMTKSLAVMFGRRRMCRLCGKLVKVDQMFTPRMQHVTCVRAQEKD
jgi:hypothetical protein